MCDDFFNDMDGCSFDPSDALQEEMFEEQSNGIEGLVDAGPENLLLNDDDDKKFNLGEAIVMGSMIAGNAYESAIDEKRRSRLIKTDNKDKK